MTTETKTIEELTDAFATNMTVQGNALNEELKTLDADYKTKRANLVTQIASVDRVVKALKVKATTQQGISFRKPMSAEGRANIAAALKARRERLAAEKADKSAEAATEAPAAIEEGDAVTEAQLTRQSLLKQDFVTGPSNDQDNGVLTSQFLLPNIHADTFRVDLLEIAEDASGSYAEGAMPLKEWQMLVDGNVVAAGYGIPELHAALLQHQPKIAGTDAKREKGAAKKGARRGRA